MASTFKYWEMIIVDDQFKDNSVEIAKTPEVQYNMFKVYVVETNIGYFPSLNRAATYIQFRMFEKVPIELDKARRDREIEIKRLFLWL